MDDWQRTVIWSRSQKKTETSNTPLILLSLFPIGALLFSMFTSSNNVNIINDMLLVENTIYPSGPDISS